MSWTYSIADLASSSKDAVRFIIGDTIQTDPQLQDEEILFALSQRSSFWGAAAMCCRSIATQFARKADTTTGELRTLYSSLSRNYALRAANYENESVARGGALPYAGGLSIADKDQQNQDSDRVQGQFGLGMDDNYIPVAPAGIEPNPPSGNN